MEQFEKQIIIPYRSISEILYRKFLFYDIAIEIFLYNGKSYYFNLYHIHNINKFTKRIKEKINKEKLIENSIEYFEKKKYLNKWQEASLSTLDYLLLINKYSDRSYNVLSHYLILPWLMRNYNDKYNVENHRNFSLPAFIKSKEELNKIIKEDEWNNGYACHFPNLYSNYMYVTHYLFRIYPHINNQIKLQDGKFDEPARQFHSLVSTFGIFKENPQVNMELIPEFYFIPELFLNLNYCLFGIYTKDKQVYMINNLSIEPNFHFILEIINYHQLNINSESFSSQINRWIDYVFGENQICDKKDDVNYFPLECYEKFLKEEINEEFEKIRTIYKNRKQEIEKNNLKEDVETKKVLISEINKAISNIKESLNKSYFYGHTPSQLFTKSHPTFNKKIETKMYNLSNSNNYQIILKNEKITLENKDFLYMAESSKGNYFYIICDHEILVFNKNLKLINNLSIKYISKIPNFFSTKYHAKDDYYQQLYNYKYLIFDVLDCKYFFIGGYMDNSLRIYYKEKEKDSLYSLYVETQIRCIRNISNEQIFFTGHENGKLMKWKYKINIDNNQINIVKKNSIRGHKSSVKMLELSEKYRCIVSLDNDEVAFIRKIYDFELLSYIKFNKYRKNVIDINIYNQIIIFTITKIKTNEIFIYTYTFNGLNLGKISVQLKLPISLIPNTDEMIIFTVANIYCANVSFNEKVSLVPISNNLKINGFDLSLEDEKDMAFKFNKDFHEFSAISHFYDIKNRVLFCLFSDSSLYRINFIKNTYV